MTTDPHDRATPPDLFEESSGDDALRAAAEAVDSSRAAADRRRAEQLDVSLASVVDRARSAGTAGLTPDDVDLLASLRRADPGRFEAVLDAAADAAKAAGRRLRLGDLRKALDVRDRAHRAAERSARRGPRPDPCPAPTRSVVLDFDLRRGADESIEALAAAGGNLYQRGNRLVRVVRAHAPDGDGRAESSITIEEIPPSALAEMLAAAAEFRARSDSGERRVSPPASLVQRVAERHDYDPRLIPPLVAVSTAPVMLASGEVVSGRTFHRASGYYLDAPAVEVPEAPTLDDARAAAERVLEPFADFHFRGEEQARRLSRAVILAAVLSALARPAIDGPVPATMFDADDPQAGKTLAAEAVAALILGRTPAVTQWSDDDEEQRKILATVAMDGDPVALLDNLRSDVAGTALEGQLTAAKIKPRLMGRQTAPEYPWRCNLLTTANGVRFSGDASRRFRFVLMRSSYGRVTGGEEPGETVRTFRHRLLVRHVLDNRPALLRDALTVLRAHALAGRPRGATLPKFEAWSDVVSSAVLWAYGADPATAEAPPSANRDHGAKVAVIAAWCSALRDRPLTLAELRARLASGEPRLLELRDALSDLADVADLARASSKSLGMRLARISDRATPAPWGGTMRVAAQPNRNGVMVYTAKCTKPPPDDCGAEEDPPVEEDHPAALPPPDAPPPPEAAAEPEAPPLPPGWQWSAEASEYWRERRAIAAEGGAPDPGRVADEELRRAVARGEVRIDA